MKLIHFIITYPSTPLTDNIHLLTEYHLPIAATHHSFTEKLIVMKKMWIKKAPVAIAIGAGVFAAASAVTEFLWNKAVVPAAHANPIDYWQAVGILAISKLLFGGFRGRGRGPMGRMWKHRMMARWEKMTPEEREQFKSRMHDCRGRWNRQDEVAVG